LGHLASHCPATSATTTMEDFASKYDREFSLVTLVSSVGSGGFGGDIRWIMDSGASLPHDGNLASIPNYHRDRSRPAGGK
jgi:hypothetical protein